MDTEYFYPGKAMPTFSETSSYSQTSTFSQLISDSFTGNLLIVWFSTQLLPTGKEHTSYANRKLSRMFFHHDRSCAKLRNWPLRDECVLGKWGFSACESEGQPQDHGNGGMKVPSANFTKITILPSPSSIYLKRSHSDSRILNNSCLEDNSCLSFE